MVQFIHEHRAQYGVESMCTVLPIAPSTYYRHQQQEKHPQHRAPRRQRDEQHLQHIRCIHAQSKARYGARKVWQQMKREDISIARCSVERLMRQAGLQGVWRGKGQRTTVADKSRSALPDLVKRQFQASRPNALWVADFTYVPTRSGFIYSAFVIDVYSRAIVGWQVTRQMDGQLVFDALEQALYARKRKDSLIHHSDRGSQYLSLRYSQRLQEAGIMASVGKTGDSYDNALAESIIGLYKTEVIAHEGPWQELTQVELATLEWVDWFNNRRLLSSIGYIPPAELELAYYRQQEGLGYAA